MKAAVKRQGLFLTGNTCPPVTNITDKTQYISILLTETTNEQITRIEAQPSILITSLNCPCKSFAASQAAFSLTVLGHNLAISVGQEYSQYAACVQPLCSDVWRRYAMCDCLQSQKTLITGIDIATIGRMLNSCRRTNFKHNSQLPSTIFCAMEQTERYLAT